MFILEDFADHNIGISCLEKNIDLPSMIIGP
jgi:hypothetical protein